MGSTAAPLMSASLDQSMKHGSSHSRVNSIQLIPLCSTAVLSSLTSMLSHQVGTSKMRNIATPKASFSAQHYGVYVWVK